jgi:hypothetical protein
MTEFPVRNVVDVMNGNRSMIITVKEKQHSMEKIPCAKAVSMIGGLLDKMVLN